MHPLTESSFEVMRTTIRPYIDAIEALRERREERSAMVRVRREGMHELRGIHGHLLLSGDGGRLWGTAVMLIVACSAS